MIAIDYCFLRVSKETLLELAGFFSKREGTCLLYSGGDFDSAKESFLFLFPFEKIEISQEREEKKRWDILEAALTFLENAPKIPIWTGFLSYEMAGSDPPLKKMPYAYFQRSAATFVLNHKTGSFTLYLAKDAEDKLEAPLLEWIKIFSKQDAFSSFLKNLPKLTSQKIEALVLSKEIEPYSVYKQKIDAIQEMIREGDVYQVNLSHEMEFQGEADPFLLFYLLSKKNPAPFSAYFSHENFSIVSSSPERFLKKEGTQLETRPIKGTISRGRSEEEDQKNRETLLNSEKEAAELLMITDLMRNDLGKISLPGSVKTDKFKHLESYQNVFHLLSIIRSEAKASLHPLAILQACFPGGSITGAPKRSAMQSIQELEKRPRGIYTGSIGYFAANGDFDFNIAIRTLLFSEKKAYLPIGGGITIDSSPEAEYEETLQKGASILQLLNLR